ncbi:hypothetical protein GCM10009660_31670 [Catellatospora bangladeshensis]
MIAIGFPWVGRGRRTYSPDMIGAMPGTTAHHDEEIAMTTSDPAPCDPAPLVGLRAALIMTLAVLAGIGAGVLAALARYHPAEAVLVGCTATAAAAALFNWVIARR